MSLKVKKRKRRGQNKKTQQESKGRSMLRSICRRAATRHMRWLLGKRKDETRQDKEGRKKRAAGSPELPECWLFLVDFTEFYSSG